MKQKTPQDLSINDLFIMQYGMSTTRFRVDRVYHDGVLAHSTRWLKVGAQFFSFDQLSEKGYHYYGRMSKLKAFFLL